MHYMTMSVFHVYIWHVKIISLSYQLAKLLIDSGTSLNIINRLDINNISCLHLACKNNIVVLSIS